MKKVVAIAIACAMCAVPLCGCKCEPNSTDRIVLYSDYAEKDVTFYVTAASYDEHGIVCEYGTSLAADEIAQELANNNCKLTEFEGRNYLVKRDDILTMRYEIEEVDRDDYINKVTLYYDTCAVIDREKDNSVNGEYERWYFPFPQYMLENIWPLYENGNSCTLLFCGEEYKVKDAEMLLGLLDEYGIYDIKNTDADGALHVALKLKGGDKSVGFALDGDTLVFDKK